MRRALLLAVIFAIPVLFSLRATVVTDPDIWWHLRTGQWIVQHWSLPVTDPFSSFGAGNPWIAYSWTFDLAVYGLYRAFGLLGILIFQTVLALATTVAIFTLARRFTDSVAGLALTAAALFAMIPMYAPRPWLLTLLLFTCEIHLLLGWSADGRTRRLLWLIPLFALWANIHIQFVYGLLVLGLACMSPAVAALANHLSPHDRTFIPEPSPGQATVRLCLLLTACVLATLATPYGWHIYWVVYDYASQPAVFNLVTEFHALTFRSIPDFIVLLMTMAAASAVPHPRSMNVGQQRLATWFEVLLVTSTAMLSFRSARDAWLIVVVAVAVVAQAAGKCDRHPFVLGSREVALAGSVLALLAALTAAGRHLTNATLQQQLASVYPVQAVREVQSHGYSGPLYNHFNWGGYLIWSLPELRVSMDGRTNVHGDKRIARSVATWNGDPGWQADPELRAARLVIAAPHDPLFLNLLQEQRFHLVYRDNVAGVFIAGN